MSSMRAVGAVSTLCLMVLGGCLGSGASGDEAHLAEWQMPSPRNIPAVPPFTDVAGTRGLLGMVGVAPNLDGGAMHSMETMAGAVAIADMDADGDWDLLVGDHQGVRLWIQEAGRFTDATQAWGLAGVTNATRVVTTFDMEGDGDQDVVLGLLRAPSMLWENVGGRLEDITKRSGLDVRASVHAIAIADVDGDQDLDLFFGNYMQWWGQFETEGYGPSDRNEDNQLWLQEGPGTFARATGRAIEEGRPTLAASFADVDLDGDQDIITANDFGAQDGFYRNDGRGYFRDESSAAGMRSGGNGMGVIFADFDGDAWLDVYISNIFDNMRGNTEGNWMFHNTGGSFQDRSIGANTFDALWSWGGAAFDADNDGDLDLVVPNGFQGAMPTLPRPVPMSPGEAGATRPGPMSGGPADGTRQPNRFFVNMGHGVFAEGAAAWGLESRVNGRGIAQFDLEGDGDIDLVHAAFGSPLMLFENKGASRGSWLEVELVGSGPNRDAIGALVFAKTGQDVQVRQRESNSGYISQSWPVLHFGLASSDVVDALHVRWPDGTAETFHEVAAGQRIRIVQGHGIET